MGEAKAECAASSLSFAPSCANTAQVYLYNLCFSFRSPYMHFPGISDYEFQTVAVLQPTDVTL